MSLANLQQALIDGDRETVVTLTHAALADGQSAADVLEDGLLPAMREVGDRFERGEYFVPEMLISADAMEGAMELLRERLTDGSFASRGKVVLGTVEGDLHDIGKRLVGMMLEGSGFDVIDLGVSVAPQKFADAVEQTGADLVGVSALLTTTLPAMEETIELIRKNDPKRTVKIMIGGAPITQPYADRIGADGYAPDASSAAALALRLAK